MTRGSEREAWLAPAKINLWLRVLGRRHDGYHDIDTGIQAIDLADTLTLEGATEGAALECRVEGEWAVGVPAGNENLAARAARLLAERTGHALRLRLTVSKAVPSGAGLGGGSSDAAAALVALARRFAVPDPGRTLHALAVELGADVAFFLAGGTQRARGIGDDLEPLATPAERWGILIYPGIAVSTAWAYRAWDEARITTPGGAPASAGRGGLPAGWRERGNDFEPLVFVRHPEARRAAAILRTGPAAVTRLSGSGSAVFALYADPATRDRELERVRIEVQRIAGARVLPFAFVDHGVRPISE